jgi:hypothetical protein
LWSKIDLTILISFSYFSFSILVVLKALAYSVVFVELLQVSVELQ